jgi:hypothetical protein
MTKVLFLISLLFFNGVLMAQSKNGPEVVGMRPENWMFQPGAVEFGAGPGGNGGGSAAEAGPVMKIVNDRGVVLLKGVDFSDGTIEFDYLPAEQRFGLMYFRWKDSLENECFYFRVDRMGQP